MWDVILSEMEDTIAEGFKCHRQLSFAHWICYILMKSIDRMFAESVATMRKTPTTFLVYNKSQLLGAQPGNRVARQPHQTPAVPEIEEEHDETIRFLARQSLQS